MLLCLSGGKSHRQRGRIISSALSVPINALPGGNRKKEYVSSQAGCAYSGDRSGETVGLPVDRLLPTGRSEHRCGDQAAPTSEATLPSPSETGEEITGRLGENFTGARNPACRATHLPPMPTRLPHLSKGLPPLQTDPDPHPSANPTQ